MRTVKKVLMALAVFAVSFGLVWIFWYPISPLSRQLANLKKAESCLPVVKQTLQRLGYSTNLTVGVFTGEGGSIRVSGNVADDAQAQEMLDMLKAAKPPVAVVFALIVGETNLLRTTINP
jgi:hypothetical protein